MKVGLRIERVILQKKKHWGQKARRRKKERGKPVRSIKHPRKCRKNNDG